MQRDLQGPPAPFRLLVTGSAAYTDADTVRRVLDRALARQPGLALVVGDCPTGLAAGALWWAAERGVLVERLAADTRRPAACLSFPSDRAAAALTQRAVAAGIRTGAVSAGRPKHHLEPGQLVWF